MIEEAIEEMLAMAGEEKARRWLAGVNAPAQSIQILERMAATHYARKKLIDGWSRRTISYQLAAKYGVSNSTAYARIREALANGPL